MNKESSGNTIYPERITFSIVANIISIRSQSNEYIHGLYALSEIGFGFRSRKDPNNLGIVIEISVIHYVRVSLSHSLLSAFVPVLNGPVPFGLSTTEASFRLLIYFVPFCLLAPIVIVFRKAFRVSSLSLYPIPFCFLGTFSRESDLRR